MRLCMLSRLTHVRLFVTLWTVAHQDPLPRGSPGENTSVGCHALLQGIFPTQGLNPCLLCSCIEGRSFFFLRLVKCSSEKGGKSRTRSLICN